jgi:hypothetical protein
MSAFTQTTGTVSAERNERQSLDPRKSDLAVSAKADDAENFFTDNEVDRGQGVVMGCFSEVLRGSLVQTIPDAAGPSLLADCRVGGFNNQMEPKR